MEGVYVGSNVGIVGLFVGFCVGSEVDAVGDSVGLIVGSNVGSFVGIFEGNLVGSVLIQYRRNLNCSHYMFLIVVETCAKYY